jgi:hypothetical protein
MRTETAKRAANAAFTAPFWQDDSEEDIEDDDMPPLPREEKPPQKMTRR